MSAPFYTQGSFREVQREVQPLTRHTAIKAALRLKVSGSKIMDLLLYQNPIIDIVIDIYVQYRYHQKLIESFHSQKLLPIDVLKSIINQQTSKL